MYVCMCINIISSCVHAYIQHAYIRTYIHAYLHIHACMHANTERNRDRPRHTHTHIYIYIHMIHVIDTYHPKVIIVLMFSFAFKPRSHPNLTAMDRNVRPLDLLSGYIHK